MNALSILGVVKGSLGLALANAAFLESDAQRWGVVAATFVATAIAVWLIGNCFTSRKPQEPSDA